MELIKNGKIVLNGKLTEQETEDLLLAAFEIIVDKKVNIKALTKSKNVLCYNMWTSNESEELTQKEYDLIKGVCHDRESKELHINS